MRWCLLGRNKFLWLTQKSNTPKTCGWIKWLCHSRGVREAHAHSFACWQMVWANRIRYVSLSLVVSFAFSHFVYSYYHHCDVFIFQFQAKGKKNAFQPPLSFTFFLFSFCVFSYHLPIFVALHCFVMYILCSIKKVIVVVDAVIIISFFFRCCYPCYLYFAIQ